MKCSACQTDNPDGYKFCSQCGSELRATCPACGFENAPGGRFCGGCGKPLGGEAAPKPAETAERRQLTVMFCDLVGSTALSERLDPEDLRDVIREYHDVTAGVLETYDGYIARYMGDGLLIYFGYPVAHEDDAERAVRSGLDILQGIAPLTAPDGTDLQVRIGVATGLVVAGDIVGTGAAEERAVLGDTPNLAARLQGLAGPGELVVSDLTKRLADGFNYLDLGQHALKGISEPVSVFRVLGEGSEPSSDGITLRRPRAFHGRREEMSRILGCWEKVRGGTGGIVTLSGDPGIGKTSLVSAFIDELGPAPSRTIACSGSPYHVNNAFRPLASLIQGLAANGDGDATGSERWIANWIEGLGLAARETGPYLGSLPGLECREFDPPAGMDAAALRERTLEAAVATVVAAARKSAVLLIAEDVQWFDASTIEFLQRLTARIADVPALVLLTFRTGFEFRAGADVPVVNVSLDQLLPSDCEKVVTDVAGGRSLPREVVEAVLERTDGVPLFVEEFTKAVLEAGLLADRDGTFVLQGRIDELSVPSTLQDSLMARLDRLGPAKEVAQTAAVVGRTFSRRLLDRVSGLAAGRLDGALNQLVAAELIEGRGAGGDIRFQFSHALVQETAYHSLLKKQRRAIHERIAGALLDESGNVADLEPELIAHHLTEAGQADRAFSYWVSAGRNAAARWANAEAIGFYDKALAVIDDLALDARDADTEVSLLLDMVAAMRIVDRFDEAFQLLDRAEERAAKAKNRLLAIRVHYLRGNLCFPLGDTEGCLREHTRAQELARAEGSAEFQARAFSGLADAHFVAGRIITAVDYFTKCVDLAREEAFPSIVRANQAIRGHLRLYLNQAEKGEADCRTSIDAAVAAGDLRVEMMSRGSSLGKILVERGEWREAATHLETALEIATQLGGRRYVPLYRCFLAKALAGGGDETGALEIARQAVEESRNDGSGYTAAMVLGVLATVTDDRGEALACLEEGSRILGSRCPAHNYLWFYPDAMDAGLRFQEWPRIEAFATALSDYCREEPIPWCDFRIARGRALAKAGEGGADGALKAELGDLRDRARAVGLLPAAAALEAALATNS